MNTKSVVVAIIKGVVSNSTDIRNYIDDGFQCDLILNQNNPLFPHWGTHTNIPLPSVGKFPFTIIFIVDGKISLCTIHEYTNEKDKFKNYSTNKLHFDIYRTNDDKYLISAILLAF